MYMDKLRTHNKCTSSSQQVAAAAAAPNQMELSASNFIQSYITQRSSSMVNGVVGEHTVFNGSNLGSCGSGKSELSNSFLSLLSGPPSQLQRGIQPNPSSTSSMVSSKLPAQNRVFGGDNYGPPLAPIGSVSPQTGNIRNGPEHFIVVPSHATSASSSSRFPDMRGIYQMENVRCNPQINQTGPRPIVQDNESGTDMLYLHQGGPSSLNFADSQQNTPISQGSLEVPSVALSAASRPTSTFGKRSPRVFCLATNGELLFTSKGALGAVCLCHGFQMSISKFCEHSGSCIANPGDAVRLETGETISRWRRFYFSKCGIRVPDDNSGWDWPETVPATVGLVNCKATVPIISKNTAMFKDCDPTKYGLNWNSSGCPNISYTGVSVMGNTSCDVMHNVWQRSAQEERNIHLKSVSGTAQGIVPADIQTMHMPKSRTGVLEKVREESGFESMADYMDFLTKSGEALLANQRLERFKFVGSGSNITRVNDSRNVSTIERDGFSSNIELRLGQPSQQSYNLDAPVIYAMQSQPFDPYNDNQKSLLQYPIFQNAVIPRVTEESRQHLHCVPLNTPKYQKGNRRKLNFKQTTPANLANVEQFKDDMVKSSHIKFSHSSTLPERGVISWASNDPISYSGSSMSSVLFGKSHGANGQTDFPRNGGSVTQAQLNNNIVSHFNTVDKVRNSQHIVDDCSYTTEINDSLFNNNQMADPRSFSGVFSYSHATGCTTMHGTQSSYLSHSSGVLQNASDSNQSNPQGKPSLLQSSNHFDHAQTARNSSTGSAGQCLPFSEASKGFYSTNSICRPSLMQLLSSKESIDANSHCLDDNILGHILDPSKQKHTSIPHEMEREDRMQGCVTVQMQQRASKLDSTASQERKEGSYHTINKDSPEFALKRLKTCSNHYVDGHFETLADIKNWWNLSTSLHGVSYLSKEHNIGNLLSQEPLKHKQAFQSPGRTGNNTLRSGEHAVCSQGETSPLLAGNHSCALLSNCSVGNCVSRGEPLDGVHRVHLGRMFGNTLKPVPSIFNNDRMVKEDNTSIFVHSENLDRQSLVKKDSYASQWRDVPSKRIEIGNAPRVERPREVSDADKTEVQVVETAVKRLNGIQVPESFNEQQMSNMYSGFSAPTVTEMTPMVNTTNSCTVAARNNRHVNEHVVDEGSGIERYWSSDDALDSERSTDTINASHMLNSIKHGKSSSKLLTQSSNGCADSLRHGSSLAPKKVRKRLSAESSIHESINETKPTKTNFKDGKRKKTVKWKSLDVSFPASGLSSVQCDSCQSIDDSELQFYSARGTQILSKPNKSLTRVCGRLSNQSIGPKKKHSTVSPGKAIPRERDQCKRTDHHRERKHACQKQLKNNRNHLKISKTLSEKNSECCWDPNISSQYSNQEMNQRDAGKAAKYNSTRSNKFSSNQVDTFAKKKKPVVCGKSGIICNGELGEDRIKPAKIVSLSTILKTARICSTTETEEPGCISTVDTKKTYYRRSSKFCGEPSFMEDEGTEGEEYNSVMNNNKKAGTYNSEAKKPLFSEDNVRAAEFSILEDKESDTSDRMLKLSTLYSGAPLKSRFKEARKRSLYELAGQEKDIQSSRSLATKDPTRSLLQCTSMSREKSCSKKVASKCHRREFSLSTTKKSVKEQKGQPYIFDLNASCSVCQRSEIDDNNCLLECSSCLIRVHQACYGVSRVPRGCWCCRPCQANSKDYVCVLCGYEGGAMTRALKSRNIVKGLLEAWIIAPDPKSENFSLFCEASKGNLRLPDTSVSGIEVDSNSPRQHGIEESPAAMLHMNSVDRICLVNSPGNFKVHNSITVGAVDPTIKQWVHMVCGLWTPGTRCPNVDTMSAFDVSGVLFPSKNVACSLCNRPGGSCIKCRVPSCFVHFHPWCAHQKGLLQSEVEGVDCDMVGFYGRCVLHVKHHVTKAVVYPTGNDTDTFGREGFICARTEGYNGRKKDGFRHKLHGESSTKSDCLVPQEQIDAWLHINGQKSCTRGFLKPPASDVEHDCRKEYARYKQAKGWKNLVVYKSGIHGLGLYTSQFISLGAMVVEYVGEIVGQRVADKREIVYQSGRKLQYKGACYFFRIDKEHIIDATQKGGIARFVNHSCLPNCAAKVISVRNENKVVFFAERDIYPGEEVTYDYHFNHEDEGEKIPCFCNSKSCRRYLN